MRYAAKTDENHKEIANAFRDLGCTVQSLHRVGGGVPDLLVSVARVTWVVEVKTRDGSETPEQIKWSGTWSGSKAIARDLDAVERIVKTMRHQAFLIAMGHG